MRFKRHSIAWGATLFLLAGRLFRFPSALQDAATGEFLRGYSLSLPTAHLLTTPLSSAADFITCNSARQDEVLIGWLLTAFWIWRARQWRYRRPAWRRELAGYALYLVCVCSFLGWTLFMPRPAAKLTLPDPDLLAVDFHSHSSYSRDARRTFTPRSNMDWHRSAGFDAAFITDHNVVEGAREAKEFSRRDWADRNLASTPLRSLEGEELSLHDTHIVVLGNRIAIDHSLYDRDLDATFRYLRDSGRYGGLPVMSLPEYWRRHPRERWDEFARQGAMGFEIVNSAPRALDFPQPLRREAVELCRKHDLFMAGATDNHGWGSSACVWNILRVADHRRLDPDLLQQAVVEILSRERFRAVQVVTRVHPPPPAMPWVIADPVLGLWALCRSLSLAQALACLLWIGGLSWVDTSIRSRYTSS